MDNRPNTQKILGLNASGKAWKIAGLADQHLKVVVICGEPAEAEKRSEDLKFFLRGTNTVFEYPSWDLLPFEDVSPIPEFSASRIFTLQALRKKERAVAITSIESILQKTLPEELVAKLSFSLEQGEELTKTELISKLNAAGFQEVSLVEEVGQMATRGSVVDFYPSTSSEPIRVELFHDHIEKIKSFNQESQRSVKQLSGITVLPVREFAQPGIHGALVEPQRYIELLKERAREVELPPSELKELVALVNADTPYPGTELTTAIGYPHLVSPLLSLPSDTLIVIDDMTAVQSRIEKFSLLVEEREQRLLNSHHLIPSKEQLYSPAEFFWSEIDKLERVILDGVSIVDPEGQNGVEQITIRSTNNNELSIRLKSKAGSGNALLPLKEQILSWWNNEYRVALVVGNKTRGQRARELLRNLDIPSSPVESSGSEWLNSSGVEGVALLTGHLSEGLNIPQMKIAIISEGEIFSDKSYRRETASAVSIKKIMSSLSQLSEGDFVVHADHGIGIYHGLKTRTVGEITNDLLHIEYGDTQLFLPVQHIEKIQKFSAAEGGTPTIDKLGSKRWTNTKKKIRESVEVLAGDLIKLYASRDVAKGWRFEPYGADDENFADTFPFNETVDQLDAIEKTILDMSEDKPMDRLVCGDVGFGKTEVAVRAAFKCLQHAKQVAVLAPTTILVDQHLETFKKRFLGHRIKIAALSRFYSSAQNKETIDRVKQGKIDIVIGTHRLLSNDVEFDDLGLVVIDEEHRFGVKQKERLKQLKTKVDVLTLTATPIPRTLHMSLLGIRDISLISTPPIDRRAIRTYVAKRDEALIRDAIIREIKRGGQVFFLHNRVKSIDLVTDELRELVPEARFEYGHGQMSEKQLEEIMHRFLTHEIDVLVSTTIIESGIDIPNANTLIVDQAHMFGLAQLYQIRGRVGRSDRQAYAYLLIPDIKKLGKEAQQRLKVLQSLDDLGLGFNLAIRDLEIRGAGNLLGKEQSGNVLAVGYELYSKILKEAILNLKGEKLPLEESVDPDVSIGISAFIPDYYVPDVSERLVLYQRLAVVRSEQDALNLLGEIEDRFGRYPEEVARYVEIMGIRATLRKFGATRLEFRAPSLRIAFSPNAPIDGSRVARLVQQPSGKYRFSKHNVLSIDYQDKPITDPTEVHKSVERVLKRIALEDWLEKHWS